MKYTCSININAALETVVQLWSNEENFIHWQDGFVKIVHIEGNPNQVGSKSKIYLKQGKREVELTETILTNNLPEEKIALYEHSLMSNTQDSNLLKKIKHSIFQKLNTLNLMA